MAIYTSLKARREMLRRIRLFTNQLKKKANLAHIAVGTCLSVDSDSIYGIYAVATLPKYRKGGIATTIMKSALVNCIAIKNQNFAPQTIKDSKAEKLYLHSGFKKNLIVKF